MSRPSRPIIQTEHNRRTPLPQLMNPQQPECATADSERASSSLEGGSNNRRRRDMSSSSIPHTHCNDADQAWHIQNIHLKKSLNIDPVLAFLLQILLQRTIQSQIRTLSNPRLSNPNLFPSTLSRAIWAGVVLGTYHRSVSLPLSILRILISSDFRYTFKWGYINITYLGIRC